MDNAIQKTIQSYGTTDYEKCLDGHIGKRVEYEQEEWDDDRAWKIVVIRCSNCGFPLEERYA